jgi:hypothetical protein
MKSAKTHDIDKISNEGKALMSGLDSLGLVSVINPPFATCPNGISTNQFFQQKPAAQIGDNIAFYNLRGHLTGPLPVLGLVGHQGNQGVNDDGHARQKQSAELICERLSAACWEKNDSGLALKQSGNDANLPIPEIPLPEDMPQEETHCIKLICWHRFWVVVVFRRDRAFNVGKVVP